MLIALIDVQAVNLFWPKRSFIPNLVISVYCRNTTGVTEDALKEFSMMFK